MRVYPVLMLILILCCWSGANPALATVRIDVGDVPVTPSPLMPVAFQLPVTIENQDLVNSVNIKSWDFTLSFSPPIPSGQIKVTGLSDNFLTTPTISGTVPASLQFVTVSLQAGSGDFFSFTTLPAGGSDNLVVINLELAQSALQQLYNVSVSSALIGYEFSSEIPASFGGSIATPEPTAAIVVFSVSCLLFQRRRVVQRYE